MPKVCLDAGHGGEPGAINGSRTEKDDNLRLALELDEQFRAHGWETVLPRKEDNFLKLDVRTSIANSEKCDLYLSCHRNGSEDAAAHGAEIWLHHLAPAEYVYWADGILASLESLGYKNRGVKLGYNGDPDKDYAVNRDTNMPSMLLEIGFITNKDDNAIFDSKLKEICAAIVDGCEKFIGYEYSHPVPPEKAYVLKLETLKAQGYTKVEITL